jgi:hypothetical protein
MDAVHVRARVAPERRHRRDRLLGARLNSLVLCPLEDEVDSERTVCQRPSGTDAVADGARRCPGQREHAGAATFETAAASSGVVALPTGACTTGAVRPSRRQSGVIPRLAPRGIPDHSYHTDERSHHRSAPGRKRWRSQTTQQPRPALREPRGPCFPRAALSRTAPKATRSARRLSPRRPSAPPRRSRHGRASPRRAPPISLPSKSSTADLRSCKSSQAGASP